MQRRDDGSVVLTELEAKALGRALRHSYELVEQLEAKKQSPASSTSEYNLFIVLELLEELGVSEDELTGKLDQQPKAG